MILRLGLLFSIRRYCATLTTHLGSIEYGKGLEPDGLKKIVEGLSKEEAKAVTEALVNLMSLIRMLDRLALLYPKEVEVKTGS